MIPANFVDLLTFLLTPAGQSLHVFSKKSQYRTDELAQNVEQALMVPKVPKYSLTELLA